jgi:hypothetical protein
MKRTLSFAVGLALLALVSTGCAVGQKIKYNGLQPEFSGRGSGKVAVAVLDHRKYILDGKKDDRFVGLFRGGYGNTFNVTTASGQPLAHDLCSALGSALKEAGYTPVRVETDPEMKPSQVLAEQKKTGAPRTLTLLLTEWKSDTYQGTHFFYDVAMRVTDGQGTELATESLDGDTPLKGSAWNPPAAAKKQVPEEATGLLEDLLNKASIKRALGAN